MEVTIDTSQIKVLQNFFDDLSTIDQRKIFMSSFRKAAKPLVDKAKADAPFKTGQLMRSIGTIELPQEIAILVGAKLTGGGKKSGWYGHILEVGSYKVGERFRRPRHKVKKGFYKGEYRGFSLAGNKYYDYKIGQGATGILKGTHFFENAYNIVQDKMYDSMTQEWYDAIDRLIIKTNKKLKK
jgi:HK97 gp10 family phage protein